MSLIFKWIAKQKLNQTIEELFKKNLEQTEKLKNKMLKL